MDRGRPLSFKSAKEIENKANEYFKMCDEKGKPYTITGLALALDTDRRTLLNYEEREDFFPTIKRIKQKIENYAEECLYSKDVPTVGVIFNLKNNYGWVDKQEVESKIDLSYEEALKKVVGKDEY